MTGRNGAVRIATALARKPGCSKNGRPAGRNCFGKAPAWAQVIPAFRSAKAKYLRLGKPMIPASFWLWMRMEKKSGRPDWAGPVILTGAARVHDAHRR